MSRRIAVDHEVNELFSRLESEYRRHDFLRVFLKHLKRRIYRMKISEIGASNTDLNNDDRMIADGGNALGEDGYEEVNDNDDDNDRDDDANIEPSDRGSKSNDNLHENDDSDDDDDISGGTGLSMIVNDLGKGLVNVHNFDSSNNTNSNNTNFESTLRMVEDDNNNDVSVGNDLPMVEVANSNFEVANDSTSKSKSGKDSSAIVPTEVEGGGGISIEATGSGNNSITVTRGGSPFKVGDLVEVAGRFWAGINRPGGVGKISKVYEELDDGEDEYGNASGDNGDGKGNNSTSFGAVSKVRPKTINYYYDVKYLVETGKDKKIALTFVKPHQQKQHHERKENLLGRCRVPGCICFITDCSHIQPDDDNYIDPVQVALEEKRRKREALLLERENKNKNKNIISNQLTVADKDKMGMNLNHLITEISEKQRQKSSTKICSLHSLSDLDHTGDSSSSHSNSSMLLDLNANASNIVPRKKKSKVVPVKNRSKVKLSDNLDICSKPTLGDVLLYDTVYTGESINSAVSSGSSGVSSSITASSSKRYAGAASVDQQPSSDTSQSLSAYEKKLYKSEAETLFILINSELNTMYDLDFDINAYLNYHYIGGGSVGVGDDVESINRFAMRCREMINFIERYDDLKESTFIQPDEDSSDESVNEVARKSDNMQRNRIMKKVLSRDLRDKNISMIFYLTNEHLLMHLIVLSISFIENEILKSENFGRFQALSELVKVDIKKLHDLKYSFEDDDNFVSEKDILIQAVYRLLLMQSIICRLESQLAIADVMTGAKKTLIFVQNKSLSSSSNSNTKGSAAAGSKFRVLCKSLFKKSQNILSKAQNDIFIFNSQLKELEDQLVSSMDSYEDYPVFVAGVIESFVGDDASMRADIVVNKKKKKSKHHRSNKFGLSSSKSSTTARKIHPKHLAINESEEEEEEDDEIDYSKVNHQGLLKDSSSKSKFRKEFKKKSVFDTSSSDDSDSGDDDDNDDGDELYQEKLSSSSNRSTIRSIRPFLAPKDNLKSVNRRNHSSKSFENSQHRSRDNCMNDNSISGINYNFDNNHQFSLGAIDLTSLDNSSIRAQILARKSIANENNNNMLAITSNYGDNFVYSSDKVSKTTRRTLDPFDRYNRDRAIADHSTSKVGGKLTNMSSSSSRRGSSNTGNSNSNNKGSFPSSSFSVAREHHGSNHVFKQKFALFINAKVGMARDNSSSTIGGGGGEYSNNFHYSSTGGSGGGGGSGSHNNNFSDGFNNVVDGKRKIDNILSSTSNNIVSSTSEIHVDSFVYSRGGVGKGGRGGNGGGADYSSVDDDRSMSSSRGYEQIGNSGRHQSNSHKLSTAGINTFSSSSNDSIDNSSSNSKSNIKSNNRNDNARKLSNRSSNSSIFVLPSLRNSPTSSSSSINLNGNFKSLLQLLNRSVELIPQFQSLGTSISSAYDEFSIMKITMYSCSRRMNNKSFFFGDDARSSIRDKASIVDMFGGLHMSLNQYFDDFMGDFSRLGGEASNTLYGGVLSDYISFLEQLLKIPSTFGQFAGDDNTTCGQIEFLLANFWEEKTLFTSSLCQVLLSKYLSPVDCDIGVGSNDVVNVFLGPSSCFNTSSDRKLLSFYDLFRSIESHLSSKSSHDDISYAYDAFVLKQVCYIIFDMESIFLSFLANASIELSNNQIALTSSKSALVKIVRLYSSYVRESIKCYLSCLMNCNLLFQEFSSHVVDCFSNNSDNYQRLLERTNSGCLYSSFALFYYKRFIYSDYEEELLTASFVDYLLYLNFLWLKLDMISIAIEQHLSSLSSSSAGAMSWSKENNNSMDASLNSFPPTAANFHSSVLSYAAENAILLAMSHQTNSEQIISKHQSAIFEMLMSLDNKTSPFGALQILDTMPSVFVIISALQMYTVKTIYRSNLLFLPQSVSENSSSSSVQKAMNVFVAPINFNILKSIFCSIFSRIKAIFDSNLEMSKFSELVVVKKHLICSLLLFQKQIRPVRGQISSNLVYNREIKDFILDLIRSFLTSQIFVCRKGGHISRRNAPVCNFDSQLGIVDDEDISVGGNDIFCRFDAIISSFGDSFGITNTSLNFHGKLFKRAQVRSNLVSSNNNSSNTKKKWDNDIDGCDEIDDFVLDLLQSIVYSDADFNKSTPRPSSEDDARRMEAILEAEETLNDIITYSVFNLLSTYLCMIFDSEIHDVSVGSSFEKDSKKASMRYKQISNDIKKFLKEVVVTSTPTAAATSSNTSSADKSESISLEKWLKLMKFFKFLFVYFGNDVFFETPPTEDEARSQSALPWLETSVLKKLTSMTITLHSNNRYASMQDFRGGECNSMKIGNSQGVVESSDPSSDVAIYIALWILNCSVCFSSFCPVSNIRLQIARYNSRFQPRKFEETNTNNNLLVFLDLLKQNSSTPTKKIDFSPAALSQLLNLSSHFSLSICGNGHIAENLFTNYLSFEQLKVAKNFALEIAKINLIYCKAINMYESENIYHSFDMLLNALLVFHRCINIMVSNYQKYYLSKLSMASLLYSSKSSSRCFDELYALGGKGIADEDVFSMQQLTTILQDISILMSLSREAIVLIADLAAAYGGGRGGSGSSSSSYSSFSGLLGSAFENFFFLFYGNCNEFKQSSANQNANFNHPAKEVAVSQDMTLHECPVFVQFVYTLFKSSLSNLSHTRKDIIYLSSKIPNAHSASSHSDTNAPPNNEDSSFSEANNSVNNADTGCQAILSMIESLSNYLFIMSILAYSAPTPTLAANNNSSSGVGNAIWSANTFSSSSSSSSDSLAVKRVRRVTGLIVTLFESYNANMVFNKDRVFIDVCNLLFYNNIATFISKNREKCFNSRCLLAPIQSMLAINIRNIFHSVFVLLCVNHLVDYSDVTDCIYIDLNDMCGVVCEVLKSIIGAASVNSSGSTLNNSSKGPFKGIITSSNSNSNNLNHFWIQLFQIIHIAATPTAIFPSQSSPEGIIPATSSSSAISSLDAISCILCFIESSSCKSFMTSNNLSTTALKIVEDIRKSLRFSILIRFYLSHLYDDSASTASSTTAATSSDIQTKKRIKSKANCDRNYFDLIIVLLSRWSTYISNDVMSEIYNDLILKELVGSALKNVCINSNYGGHPSIATFNVNSVEALTTNNDYASKFNLLCLYSPIILRNCSAYSFVSKFHLWKFLLTPLYVSLSLAQCSKISKKSNTALISHHILDLVDKLVLVAAISSNSFIASSSATSSASSNDSASTISSSPIVAEDSYALVFSLLLKNLTSRNSDKPTLLSYLLRQNTRLSIIFAICRNCEQVYVRKNANNFNSNINSNCSNIESHRRSFIDFRQFLFCSSDMDATSRALSQKLWFDDLPHMSRQYSKESQVSESILLSAKGQSRDGNEASECWKPLSFFMFSNCFVYSNYVSVALFEILLNQLGSAANNQDVSSQSLFLSLQSVLISEVQMIRKVLIQLSLNLMKIIILNVSTSLLLNLNAVQSLHNYDAKFRNLNNNTKLVNNRILFQLIEMFAMAYKSLLFCTENLLLTSSKDSSKSNDSTAMSTSSNANSSSNSRNSSSDNMILGYASYAKKDDKPGPASELNYLPKKLLKLLSLFTSSARAEAPPLDPSIFIDIIDGFERVMLEFYEVKSEPSAAGDIFSESIDDLFQSVYSSLGFKFESRGGNGNNQVHFNRFQDNAVQCRKSFNQCVDPTKLLAVNEFINQLLI